MKTKTIPFAELRRYLQNLGYKEKVIDNGKMNAHVFSQSGEKNPLLFRRYGDHELVSPRDLYNTRMFLDAWGLLEADDFDAFLDRAATPA